MFARVRARAVQISPRRDKPPVAAIVWGRFLVSKPALRRGQLGGGDRVAGLSPVHGACSPEARRLRRVSEGADLLAAPFMGLPVLASRPWVAEAGRGVSPVNGAAEIVAPF